MEQFEALADEHIQFIEAQKMFFVATGAAEGRINLSPKGLDSLRVLDKNRIIWLNLTGSGNETAAHVQDNPRMTLMLNAFEGPAQILRIYGDAKVIHHKDADWAELIGRFPPSEGARQIFDLDISLVQTSCGYAVPEYDYKKDRDILTKWAKTRGEDGIKDYWRNKNTRSIDGFETHIVEKNLDD
jgi:hypothetical protein